MIKQTVKMCRSINTIFIDSFHNSTIIKETVKIYNLLSAKIDSMSHKYSKYNSKLVNISIHAQNL